MKDIYSAKPINTLSSESLNEWRGSLSTFQGFTGTLPEKELNNVGWDEIAQVIRPEKPAMLFDKKSGQFFVPCPLKEAPLVGKTLQVAEANGTATTGKMRSKSHVTEAAMLIMDIDGLPEDEFIRGLDKIKSDGITYLAYTTYSHGLPEKPGIRARLVIPLDRPVNVADYSAVWHGFDKAYWDGQAGKADSSGANLYQQQGTWCCSTFRRGQEQYWENKGGVASSEALIGSQPVKEISVCAKQDNPAKTEYPPSDANKIAGACKQIGLFRNNKGTDQSEPLWHDSLGIVGHCEDGKNICQLWSSGHVGYSETDTASKLANRMKLPPTTCNQFRKTNPIDCNGCVHTCNSPISLGIADPFDSLQTIQQRYALIIVTGKLFMFDRGRLAVNAGQLAPKLELSPKSDATLLIKRAVKAKWPNDNDSKISSEFFVSPGTTCYDGVEFNPTGASENFLNLWVGPTLKPKSGAWPLIESFLRDVICDGNDNSYQYLLKFIAHALQRPEEKPGIMPILLGGQGIGKGTLARILQKIWSATYLHVINIDAVTGTFNASLERAYIVFMDEALFSGDRRASDALKSLVTEPLIHINEKHQPARQTCSYHRFFAATNADHFKNTESDDRRDFVLRVSESKKGNHEYWSALNAEIENGGVAALLHDLYVVDLSEFNVRAKPETNELLEQKLFSLQFIERWWYDCLDRGEFTNGGYDSRFNDVQGEWGGFISTDDAIKGVMETAGGKVFRRPNANEVKKVLTKICPSGSNGQRIVEGVRRRGLKVPPLQQARTEFERYIGGAVKWTEDEV